MDDPEILNHRNEHTPAKIRKRLAQGRRHSYLKDFIYGAIDGAVTTFAIVAGVAGAGLSDAIIIILGLANVLADGFSMAVSNFLGTRAERQVSEKARREEESHIRIFPEGEREEIRQIFASKGFEGTELERVVAVITSDKEQWVNTMIQEELGLTIDGPPASRAALSTFCAFIAVGSIPLLPYFFNALASSPSADVFSISAAMTGVAFFGIGALKSRFVDQHWAVAGAETLGIGGSAALIAYVVGILLSGIA